MIFTKEMIKNAILSDSNNSSVDFNDDLHSRRQKNKIVAEKTDFVIDSIQKTQNEIDSPVYFAPEELDQLKQVLSNHFFNKLGGLGVSNV